MPCGLGKRRYVNKDDAKRAKKNINTTRFSAVKITNIYWCEPCSGYHLTSMSKSESREITRKNNKK